MSSGNDVKSEAYAEGQKDGQHWAKHLATPRELRLLAEYEPYENSWEWELGVCVNGQNEGIAVGLWQVMHPKTEYDRDRIDDFWNAAIRDEETERLENVEFALGFVEAAIEFRK